jgi:hypothetical protein
VIAFGTIRARGRPLPRQQDAQTESDQGEPQKQPGRRRERVTGGSRDEDRAD